MVKVDRVMDQAKDFYKAWEFDKARKFYGAVIDRLPDSPQADEARKMIREIDLKTTDFSDLFEEEGIAAN